MKVGFCVHLFASPELIQRLVHLCNFGEGANSQGKALFRPSGCDMGNGRDRTMVENEECQSQISIFILATATT